MKKEEAEKIASALEKEIKGQVFTHKTRGEVYLIRYVDLIENPISSNEFHVYVGFQKIDDLRIILDPKDLFLNEFKQI